MKKSVVLILTWFLAITLFAVSLAWAIDWNLKGSLGEGEHKHYVPPVSNPILNETPFITTEVRPFYIYHSFPDTVPGLGLPGGGNANIWAVQLRVALTDRLGFIANKDGWADVNFKAPGLSDDGLANLSFGFKYALISDPKQETIVTAGLTYEAPTGRLKAGPFWLQGNGDGFLNPFITAAKSFDKVGVQGMVGAKFALDRDKNASWFNFAVHMDYEILPNFFPLVEFNGFVPIDEANLTPFVFEGFDVVSIGGSDVSSVISFAAGSRYRITDHLIAGIAYEIPLTDDEDILDWRLTADLVIYY